MSPGPGTAFSEVGQFTFGPFAAFRDVQFRGVAVHDQRSSRFDDGLDHRGGFHHAASAEVEVADDDDGTFGRHGHFLALIRPVS